MFSLFVEILFAFKPNAVVVQCGADSLAFDPLGGFNLSIEGLGLCVQRILKADLPTLFLGGGGYSAANASRYDFCIDKFSRIVLKAKSYFLTYLRYLDKLAS